LFVPVISAATQARLEGYFRLEWKLAAQRTHLMAEAKPFLLPVVIDATRDAEAHVPAEFKAVQWTRLPGGEAAEKFCGRVKRLLCGAEKGGDSRPDEDSGPKSSGHKASPATGRHRPLAWALAGVALLVAAGALMWFARRGPSGTSVHASARPPATAGISSELSAGLEKVRRMRVKIDVTRAELEAASSLLELADRQYPNRAEVWAEWSLVDARFVTEMLDTSDARRESMRQRARRAYGLEPEMAAARFAEAQAVWILNPGDPAAQAQAKALLEPLAEKAEVDPWALLLLSQVSRDPKKPEASFRYLDRLAQTPGGAVQAHLARGIAFVFADRWADAEAEIDRALALESASKLHMWKGYIQAMWHGDMPGAQRSIAAVPPTLLQEDFPAAAALWVHLWTRDWDKAVGAMRALPRDYIDSGALSGPTGYFKGFALARAGKPAAAETELRGALEVVEARLKAKPNTRSFLVAKGLVLAALGAREQAAQVRRLVVELYGERSESWMDDFLAMEVLAAEDAIRSLAQHAEKTAFVTSARLRLDPYLDRLRGHPDFVALQAKVDADPRLAPAARAKAAAPPADAEKSVAVLAFEHRGAENDGTLALGIADDLIMVLGRVPGLRVAARTSSFHFQGRSTPVREIARDLGVNYVVEGSVQKEGARVKVNVSLINAATGFPEWREQLVHELGNVLALQERIAAEIARRLSLQLGAAGQRRGNVDPRAFELYAEARLAWGRRTAEGFAVAEQALQQAIALEPRYGQAHAALVDVENLRGQWNDRTSAWRGRDGPEVQRLLAKCGEVLAIDATSTEAKTAIGGVMWVAWRFAESERALREAIRLNPNNATAHQWLGRVLLTQGRMEEALASLATAARLDPLAPRILDNRAWALVLAGRLSEAGALLDRALTLQPDAEQAAGLKAVVLAMRGERQAATVQARTISNEASLTAWLRVQVLALAGETPEAEALIAGYSEGNLIAKLCGLAALGRQEAALAALDPDWLVSTRVDWLLYHPIFDPMRNDPRFRSMLRTVGLEEAHARAQAWRAAHPPEKPEAKR
jgi:TolB-like protein/predicted Zn-dependent protease